MKGWFDEDHESYSELEATACIQMNSAYRIFKECPSKV